MATIKGVIIEGYIIQTQISWIIPELAGVEIIEFCNPWTAIGKVVTTPISHNLTQGSALCVDRNPSIQLIQRINLETPRTSYLKSDRFTV